MTAFQPGDRVQVDYGHGKYRELYQGTVKEPGFMAEQWRIIKDGGEKAETVHEKFIKRLSKPERTAA